MLLLARQADVTREWDTSSLSQKASGQPSTNISQISSDAPTWVPVVTSFTFLTLHSDLSARVSREVQVSEVTENSARLHWERPEPSSSYFYDLTVTSAHDQSLVLRQNLTVTDRVIGGLLAGQLYHVVVVSYLQSQVRAIYQGSFNTSKY